MADERALIAALRAGWAAEGETFLARLLAGIRQETSALEPPASPPKARSNARPSRPPERLSPSPPPVSRRRGGERTGSSALGNLRQAAPSLPPRHSPAPAIFDVIGAGVDAYMYMGSRESFPAVVSMPPTLAPQPSQLPLGHPAEVSLWGGELAASSSISPMLQSQLLLQALRAHLPSDDGRSRSSAKRKRARATSSSSSSSSSSSRSDRRRRRRSRKAKRSRHRRRSHSSRRRRSSRGSRSRRRRSPSSSDTSSRSSDRSRRRHHKRQESEPPQERSSRVASQVCTVPVPADAPPALPSSGAGGCSGGSLMPVPQVVLSDPRVMPQVQLSVTPATSAGFGRGSPIVCILGHSYISMASKKAELRPGGRSLGFQQIQVVWKGVEGLRWSQVLPEVVRLSRCITSPVILVLHVGGNDLGYVRMSDLMSLIRSDLERIPSFFREAVVVWSEIVSRVNWQGARDHKAMERARRTVNARLSRFVRSKGGVVVRHRELEGDNSQLMKSDGVNLNDAGMEIFLSGLQEGIVEALSLLGRDRSPV
ncbi:uncharacterized protein RB166_016655 [Leptodactylus fuscus]|uniref:uncharacterized protein LOC142216570 n=1 Tax=Leptodactylus fuscus TaxID=238119 RepID=UPI003F4F0523